MSFAPETDSLAKPQTLMRVPVGLASPLWGLFAGVAVGGATWWWMTRWARPANLEAMFGAAAKFETAMETETAALEAPPIEAAEPVVETLPEPIAAVAAEPVVEAAPEPVEEPAPAPVLEAQAEVAPEREPMDGEVAPISPVLETLAPEPAEPAVVDAAPAEAFAEPAAAPKAKKKAAAPKAD